MNASRPAANVTIIANATIAKMVILDALRPPLAPVIRSQKHLILRTSIGNLHHLSHQTLSLRLRELPSAPKNPLKGQLSHQRGRASDRAVSPGKLAQRGQQTGALSKNQCDIGCMCSC